MKLLTYRTTHGWALGIKTTHGVLDVAAAGQMHATPWIPLTMEAALCGGEGALTALRSLAAQAGGDQRLLLDEAELQLGPCVPYPGKIICIGLNYRKHAAESGMAVPASPVVFAKFGNTLAGNGEAVPLPAGAVQYDYEVELGVVIGKRTRYITPDQALAHVAGYCTANDLTARDLQFRTSQWHLGKTLDKFLPVGPYLVTSDEVQNPQALQLRTWVNGELRQEELTADMIFPVAELVSYLSQFMTLEPGDLIVTGTPSGVIMGMAEKVWLKPGDEVTVEVEGLGRLTNVMTAEG